MNRQSCGSNWRTQIFSPLVEQRESPLFTYFAQPGRKSDQSLFCCGQDIIQAAIEILTPIQVAERLRVKPTWVYEQTRKRTGVRNPDPFPHIKMGLYLRFDWNDVVAWLERQKRGGVRSKDERSHR